MKIKIIYGVFILLMVVVSGLFYDHTQGQGEGIIIDEKIITGASELETETTMIVYVTGAVEAPGVYELTEGVRLFEVIEKAGGFADGALEDRLNLARYVFDGEQVHVMSLADEASGLGQLEGLPIRISINSGSVEELMTLTGVGQAKAEAIIVYRQTNGPFQKIEDIMKVTGIKEAMYNKIKDDIEI